MSKYKSEKAILDGITFDSKDEMKYYEYLKMLKIQGGIINFELQPKYTLIPAFKYFGKARRAMTYTPDFKIYHLDGTEELIDIKGFGTQQGELRRKLFEYFYPKEKLTWIARNIKYGDQFGWIEYGELKRKKEEAKKNGKNQKGDKKTTRKATARTKKDIE